MMTKKDFIALGDSLRDTMPEDGSELSAAQQWNKTIDVLCGFMKRNNYNFNEPRWRDYLNGACGPSGGKIGGKTKDKVKA